MCTVNEQNKHWKNMNWIYVYLCVYLFLKLSFLFVFQSGENTNQNRYGASFVLKFIRESMVGPCGPPPRAQSGVKSTWVVPKILWWVTLFNEFNLLSMYAVTPILEGKKRLKPPKSEPVLRTIRKNSKIGGVLKILLHLILQNRRFCVLLRKNSKIGGFA